MCTIYIKRNIYDQIMDTVGSYFPETGGIVALDQNRVIADFYFDINAKNNHFSYSPTCDEILRIVNCEWAPKGLMFGGIVHSHPQTAVPSLPDIQMATLIMRANHMREFIMPIVVDEELHCFAIDKGCHLSKLEYILV